MYEVLDREDVVLAESLLNNLVVGEGDTLLVDLAIAALVDQLANRLEVGLANVMSDSQLRWAATVERTRK